MTIGPDGDPALYVDGEAFHREHHPVYRDELGWAVNKTSASMARVLYRAPHENRSEDGERRGRGRDWATWIFSEEPGIAEHLFRAPLELIIDARLEPDACIGLHWHRETEEVYVVLEGEVTMTTVDPVNGEASCRLVAGDAHAVRLGQGHFGRAGPEGVRFLAVAVRAGR